MWYACVCSEGALKAWGIANLGRKGGVVLIKYGKIMAIPLRVNLFLPAGN